MKYLPLFAFLSIFIANSLCAEETKTAEKIPDWVLNPVIENGLASTSCVLFSENLSIMQKQATMNSRVAIAQQIDTRVDGIATNNEVDTAGYEATSKQVTNQKIIGERVLKQGYVNINGKKYYCIMLILTPDNQIERRSSALNNEQSNESKEEDEVLSLSQEFELQKTIMQLIGNVDESEELLYQEFKALKAMQDLEDEIEKLIN